ncbi:MAG: hypothetical protein GTO24_20945, partial [candidate division Zixibacteria bacterium]|nr:hypothetical protein [candidate division Zixibacteria bacterium]
MKRLVKIAIGSRLILTVVAVVVLIVVTTPQTVTGQDAVAVNIRAWIDGRSQIITQDNQLWWRHFDHAAPGLWGTVGEPTLVNGFQWQPVWPFSGDGNNCNCESS